MANSDPLEIRLIDPDLLTTHGILPLMRADYYVQLNEPGSGNFEISTGSSLSSSVESDAFADVFYRGSSRGGFLVENISRAHANSSEGGGRTVTASGRGSLALMEDAIVWDDGTGSTERTFSGTQAATLITLMQEAQNRGGLQNIIWDFSATNDTDSVAWTDDEDLVLTVGTSLLDVIRQISDNGIDFDISRSGDEFTLHAYKNGAGSDKSSTVYFRVGQNCEEVSSDEVGGDIRNVLKTKYEGGYTTVSNSASILARRRREGLLDARYAQSTSTARTFAAAHLDGKKDPKHQISIKVYDGVGPRVFVDYELGDTITLDIDGTETEYRIRGMHLHWDNSEYASVTLTMNDDIMENEIKLTREFNRLKTDFTSARDADLLEVSFWAAIGDPNITYTVNSLVISAGVLYVASLGSILTYDLDNGGWTRVLTVSDTIMCIAVNGSDIYFGTVTGNVYKHSGGTTTQIGNSAMSSDPGFESIFCMVNFNGAIYVGGYFDSMSSVSTNGFAVYSGGSWSDGGGVGSFLNADTDGVNILASTGATVKVFDGASWSSLGDPSALTVSCVAIYGTQYLAGTAANIYLYDGSWAVFEGGVTGNVNAISVYLTDVYVGGSFTDRGSKIAKCSGGEWFELEEGVNGNVSYLAMRENDLYVSGAFTTAGDKNAQGIAAYLQNFDSLTNYLEHAPGEFNLGEAIHNATAKTSLTGDDEMPLWDSISKALRKITWTNIVASIKTWADTIYVSLTGNQTIAGVKTFSSDPLIPDEAYDATAWNGSLEPPTKNAVRDKIESMSGGGGTPGGSDTEIQYNNSGVFAGDAEFTFDATTKTLHVGPATRGVRIIGDDSDIHQYAPDSANPVLDQHAWAGVPAVIAFTAEGTLALQSAVSLGKVLWQVAVKAYNGTDFKDTGRIRCVATENHNGTSSGTKWEVYCVSNTTNTEVLVATFDQNGNINIASGKTYNVNGSPHVHSASDITSGTMATARLGSGTANSSTYLRGDQTWAAVSGGLPEGHFHGFTLSNDGTDPTNDIGIAAGSIRDDTNTVDIILASALIKRLDASWAVGTNQGFLDTGSIANTTYHVWAIKRSDTGVVDVLASTSASSPTMPANYDYKAYLGAIVRLSGAIKLFKQLKDTFLWDTPTVDVNVTNPGTSAVTRTLTLPTGKQVIAIVNLLGYGTSAAANTQGILLSDLSMADIAPYAGVFSVSAYSDVAGITQNGAVCMVRTDTSAQIRSRVQVSAAGTGIVIGTQGWIDPRGRT